MDTARCIDLFSLTSNNEVTVTSFCFERTALNYAREAGLTSYVIAIKGRILRWEGVSNALDFMSRAAAAA